MALDCTKIHGIFFFSVALRFAPLQLAAMFNLESQTKQQPDGKSLIL